MAPTVQELVQRFEKWEKQENERKKAKAKALEEEYDGNNNHELQGYAAIEEAMPITPRGQVKRLRDQLEKRCLEKNITTKIPAKKTEHLRRVPTSFYQKPDYYSPRSAPDQEAYVHVDAMWDEETNAYWTQSHLGEWVVYDEVRQEFVEPSIDMRPPRIANMENEDKTHDFESCPTTAPYTPGTRSPNTLQVSDGVEGRSSISGVNSAGAEVSEDAYRPHSDGVNSTGTNNAAAVVDWDPIDTPRGVEGSLLTANYEEVLEPPGVANMKTSTTVDTPSEVASTSAAAATVEIESSASTPAVPAAPTTSETTQTHTNTTADASVSVSQTQNIPSASPRINEAQVELENGIKQLAKTTGVPFGVLKKFHLGVQLYALVKSNGGMLKPVIVHLAVDRGKIYIVRHGKSRFLNVSHFCECDSRENCIDFISKETSMISNLQETLNSLRQQPMVVLWTSDKFVKDTPTLNTKKRASGSKGMAFLFDTKQLRDEFCLVLQTMSAVFENPIRFKNRSDDLL